jgi:hypothetical protein
MILAALAGGVGAGTSDAVRTAVLDAYTGLRDALRRRLAGRQRGLALLDADERDAGVWRTLLGNELVETGADRDEQILAAARRLLELVDPAGAETGKYAVEVSGGQGIQVGDGTVHVDNAYGPTASTISGPVTVSYGQTPVPPVRPET